VVLATEPFETFMVYPGWRSTTALTKTVETIRQCEANEGSGYEGSSLSRNLTSGVCPWGSRWIVSLIARVWRVEGGLPRW
jgi:hypothetical protein